MAGVPGALETGLQITARSRRRPLDLGLDRADRATAQPFVQRAVHATGRKVFRRGVEGLDPGADRAVIAAGLGLLQL
ncbi:MAG TPA: hypothetical protein VIU64_21640, partial [Polyangia bacterium]